MKSLVASVEERRVAAGVLVVGTGAAGLRAAIELAERGVQVLCLAKRRRDDAHTVLASGGINAALGTMDPEDSWHQHAADTLREGYWLGDPRSVEVLCREAPAAIDDLVRWGARFAHEPERWCWRTAATSPTRSLALCRSTDEATVPELVDGHRVAEAGWHPF